MARIPADTVPNENSVGSISTAETVLVSAGIGGLLIVIIDKTFALYYWARGVFNIIAQYFKMFSVHFLILFKTGNPDVRMVMPWT